MESNSRTRMKVELLLALAELGACDQRVIVRLKELAERLGCSRQTVHRRLLELEREGLISREPVGRNLRISITSKGRGFLRSLHLRLSRVLSSQRKIKISGVVVPGLGEGSYYVQLPFYSRQLEKLLGEKPFPGTLNVKLNGSSAEIVSALKEMPSQIVKGLKTKVRTFGDVKYFPALIGQEKAAVILPVRSHHSGVVEIISPKNLRKCLGLRDGDPVDIEVMV